jgi:hypothetical protein
MGTAAATTERYLAPLGERRRPAVEPLTWNGPDSWNYTLFDV